MYYFIQDKEFLKRLKGTCNDIVNQLVQSINNDSVMTVKACRHHFTAHHLPCLYGSVYYIHGTDQPCFPQIHISYDSESLSCRKWSQKSHNTE